MFEHTCLRLCHGVVTLIPVIHFVVSPIMYMALQPCATRFAAICFDEDRRSEPTLSKIMRRLVRFPRKYTDEFLVNRFPVQPQPLRDDMPVRAFCLLCLAVIPNGFCHNRLTNTPPSKSFTKPSVISFKSASLRVVSIALDAGYRILLCGRCAVCCYLICGYIEFLFPVSVILGK